MSRPQYRVDRSADRAARHAIPEAPRKAPGAAVRGPLGGSGDPRDPPYWPLLCAYVEEYVPRLDALLKALWETPCTYPDEDGRYDFRG